MNIHHFDKLFSEELIEAYRLLIDSLVIDFVTASSVLCSYLNDNAKDMITTYIVGDDANNLEPNTGLNAKDLLRLAAVMCEGNDLLIHLLNEQFVEMRTGTCPQGRVTRFINALNICVC